MIDDISQILEPTVQFSLLPEYESNLPELKQHTDGSVGTDLYCAEDAVILPGEKVEIPCGVKIQLPDNYFCRIESRSSTFMLGLGVRVSVIDTDFRGELFTGCVNESNETVKISAGDRLCQMVLYLAIKPKIEYVEKLSKTERGEKGFGSTSISNDLGEYEFVNKEFINDLYSDACLSPLEISRRYNVPKDVVVSRIKKFLGLEVKYFERNKFELSNTQKELIIGGILGNMRISKKPYWFFSRLEFNEKHCDGEYLNYKKNIMGRLVTENVESVLEENNVMFHFHTVTHPMFDEYYEKFVEGGEKVLPDSDCLADAIGPLSLAIFVMDKAYFHDGWIRFDVSHFDPDSACRLADAIEMNFGIKATEDAGGSWYTYKGINKSNSQYLEYSGNNKFTILSLVSNFLTTKFEQKFVTS